MYLTFKIHPRKFQVHSRKSSKINRKKNFFNNEDTLRSDNMKCYRDPRGKEREREKEAQNLFEEIIAEKFPNSGKEKDIQIKESPSF